MNTCGSVKVISLEPADGASLTLSTSSSKWIRSPSEALSQIEIAYNIKM
jgi:hypothetical protein